MKNFILLTLCLWVGITHAQTNKIPAGLLPQQATFYVDSLQDTTARKLFIGYGGKNSDRIARYAELKNAAPSYSFVGSVSSQPSTGDAPTNLQQFINLFYKSNPPTVSINGSLTLELTGQSTASSNFGYAYGKQAGTKDITTVTIYQNGQPVSTPPVTASGGSGTYLATYPTNQQNTISIIASTLDNKSSSASAVVNYAPRVYAGVCAGSSPTQSEILAASGGSKPLSNSRAYTATFTFSASNVHVFFAYPNSFGATTSIKDAAGNQLINAYTQGTLSLTNANSYTQTYRYVVSNNTYSNTTLVSTFQ